MEKVSKDKSQSQFLSLVVKKISQDRLSKKEVESYNLLKMKVDPNGKLEDELSTAWKIAEQEYKVYSSCSAHSQTSKFSVRNIFRI